MNSLITEDKVVNKNLIKKNVIIFILAIWSIVVIFLSIFLFGYNKAKQKYEVEISLLEDENNKYKEELISVLNEFENIDNYGNPYTRFDFLFRGKPLNNEYALTIIALSNHLNIDPDFCVSILNQENPDLKPNARNKNPNGTRDLGLWQLNDKYIEDFKKGCWIESEYFDPYNWTHNTWVAVHHIAELYNHFGDYEKAARAYNGGYSRANKPTKDVAKYAESVMETFNNIKAS